MIKIDAQMGDVWQLGRHRLLCGDATITEDVQRLMGDDRAHMIFTDPPWNVFYEGHGTKRNGIQNDKMQASKFENFLTAAFSGAAAAALPGCMVFVVMGTRYWPLFSNVMKQTGFRWSDVIMWVKDTFVVSWGDYHGQYEPLWYGWRNAPQRLHPVTDRKQSNVWHIKRPKISALHPTTKPLELVERALNNSTNADDIVLNMFAGSGTTLIAAENTGRVCRAVEIDTFL